MAIIKSSITGKSDLFNFNGLEYEKNKFYIFYDDPVLTLDGSIDEDKVKIGIWDGSDILQAPIKIKEYKNASGTPYNSFVTLVNDLYTLLVDLTLTQGSGGSGGGGVEETATSIKTKLETLTGTARLDASAIQNLPEVLDNASEINYDNSDSGLSSSDVKSGLDELSNTKQEALVSGTTIKTINNQSLLGSGNINIVGSGGGGSSNPNEFNPTSEADLSSSSNANLIACIQSDITLTADLTLADGLILKNCGGSLNIGNFTLTGQNNTILFDNDEVVINAFSGTIEGTWNQPRINATNLGAIDDDSINTDNFNVGKNLLHLINQSSGHLYWNKKDTGKYYVDCNDDVFGSPFYQNIPNRDLIWLVGDGYDNVTVEHAGNVEIKVVPGFTDEQAIYVTYDCHSPRITGGTIRGDRYLHQYDQELEVNSAATSNGNVQLRIVEHPKRADNLTENEIIVSIPLTLSSLTNNRQEVADFINNNNVELSDYTATFPGVNGDSGDPDKINVSGAPGVFYTFFFTDLTSGASVSQDVSPYEWGHGIVFGSNTRFPKVDNIQITEFFGDGIARQVQENGQPGLDFADLTQGYIEDDGTINGGNTDFYYMTDTRNVPTQHPWIQFRQGTSSTIDLAYYRYRVAFYNNSDTFIKVSKWLEPNEIYQLEPEWVKYRIIVDNNGSDISNFDYFFQSPSNAYKAIIEDCEISFNRRHAITNPPNGSVMRNLLIHDNGGVEPQSGINIEDFGKRSIGYQIHGCEFWNQTAIDIILKGCSKVKIFNNKFQSNTTGIRNNPEDKDIAISAAYSRVVEIYSNDFHNKSVSVDIQHMFHNNYMYECELNVRAGGAVVSDNVFLNSKLRDGSIGNIVTGSASTGSPSYIEGNKLLYNRGWSTTPIIDEENTLVWVNNIVEFNHTVSQHADLTDSDVRLIELNNSSTNFLKADNVAPTTYLNNGSYKGLSIKNVKASAGALHSVGWPMFACNAFDIESSTSIEVDAGYFKDFKMERLDVTGWLEFILAQYPTDGVGEFKTITVKNSTIRVPERTSANEGYLNNSSFGGTQRQKVLRTKLDANVNFIFDNVEFLSDDVTDTQFMFLGHRGTTVFKDCTFSAPSSENINLSLTGTDGRSASIYAGANTGEVTIINPTYNNISFTLRAGDTESFYGGTSTDVNAIHDNVAGEINAITAKATPVAGDIVLIEDSEDSFNKKKVDLTNLLGGGSGVTNLSFNPTTLEVESSTGTNAAIPLAQSSPGDAGLMSDSDKAKLDGIEQGATADQNASEVSVAATPTNYTAASADVEAHLAGLDAAVSGGGLDTTQTLTLSDGDNSSPFFELQNDFSSDNYRLRQRVLNSIAYIEFQRVSDNAYNQIRVGASQFNPYATGVASLGTNTLRWDDAYFAGNVIIGGQFRVDGGLETEFLKADGSVDDTSYLPAPSTSLVNVDRDFVLTDAFNTIYTSSSNRTFTVRLDATTNFPIGTRLFIKNQSNANVATIAFEGGITVDRADYELSVTKQGGFIVAQKLAADSWQVVSSRRYDRLDAKTSNYTLAINDDVIEYTVSGFTATLPDLTTMVNKEFTIANSSGGSITVDTTSSQQIYVPGGQVSTVTLTDGESLTIKSQGTYWRSL